MFIPFLKQPGGSADLTGSNLTRVKNAEDFQHSDTKLGSYRGNYIRYGVREHGMGAIMNGIAAYGGIIPYAGTFLVSPNGQSNTSYPYPYVVELCQLWRWCSTFECAEPSSCHMGW